MSTHLAMALLKDFAYAQLPKNPYRTSEDHALNQQTAIVEKRKRFDAADDIANHLSFPVRIYWRDLQEQKHFRGVTILEIRHYDEEYLFRVDPEDGQPEQILSSHNIFELYAGEFGILHLQDPKFYHLWEKGAIAFHNQTVGSFITPLALDVKTLVNEARAIRDWVEVWRIFQGGRHLELRLQLNVLMFLARADAYFCPKEHAVIRDHIRTALKDEPQLNDALWVYATHTKLTPAAFTETMQKLETLNPAALPHLMQQAETLIKANGVVTLEESQFFTLMKQALGA